MGNEVSNNIQIFTVVLHFAVIHIANFLNLYLWVLYIKIAVGDRKLTGKLHLYI